MDTRTDNDERGNAQRAELTLGTITLPAHWASALVNGDFSGLDADESKRCQSAIDALACRNESVVSMSDKELPRFTWQYHLYDKGAGVSGGTVADYVTHRL